MSEGNADYSTVASAMESGEVGRMELGSDGAVTITQRMLDGLDSLGPLAIINPLALRLEDGNGAADSIHETPPANLPAPLAVLAQEGINYEVVEGRHVLDVVADIKARYTLLKIAGMQDKDGIAAVKAAKAETKDLIHRVEVRRKANKADLILWGNRIQAGAEFLKSELAPVVDALEKELARIEREKEAAAEVARQAKAKILQARVDAMTAAGGKPDIAVLSAVSERAFQVILRAAMDETERAKTAREAQEAANREALAKTAAEARAAEDARRVAKEAEEKERAEAIAQEETRQAKARQDQAAKQADLDRQAREIKEKQAALDAAKAETDRQAREEKIRTDAIAKAAADAEALAKAEAERKAAEEKRQAEIAAAAPDADKLAAFGAAVLALSLPEMATLPGQLARVEILDARARFGKFIHAKAAALTEFNVTG